VKGWTQDTWRESLDAYAKRERGGRLSADERRAVGKIDDMLKQLEDAATGRRRAPILAVSDVVKGDRLRQLQDIVSQVRGARVVQIPESTIRALRDSLTAGLGIPPP